jgi:hypothetical protein
MLKRLGGATPSESIDDAVSVVYYPADYHTEIIVGKNMYNPVAGYSINASVAAVEKSAKQGNSAYIRFKLRVNKEELESLRQMVGNNELYFQMCTGGTCRAINKSTGMTIPFPFSKMPASNAIYLTLKKVLNADFGRIVSIEYVGNPKQLIGLAIMAIPESFAISIGVIVTYVTTKGIYQTIFVPLEEK